MTSAKRSIMINEPAPTADSPQAHPLGPPRWCHHLDDPDMTISPPHHPQPTRVEQKSPLGGSQGCHPTGSWF